MVTQSISIEILISALFALDNASTVLAKAPGDNAFAAYLQTVKARAELKTALGLLGDVEIAGYVPAQTKTANPVRLAA